MKVYSEHVKVIAFPKSHTILRAVRPDRPRPRPESGSTRPGKISPCGMNNCGTVVKCYYFHSSARLS